MKTKLRLILCLSLLISHSALGAWGGADNGSPTSSQNTQSPSGAGPAAAAGSSGVSSASPQASEAVTRNAQGVYNQANQASKSSGKGQSLAMVAAAILGYKAIEYCAEKNYPACGLAIAGVAASYALSSNMSKTRNSANAVRDMATNNPNFDPNSDLQKMPEFKPVAAAVDQLEKMGAKVDLKNGKFSTPDGKSYSASDFSSESSMKAAGFSEDQVAKFGEMMRQAGADAQKKVAALPVSEGDFGGGGGGSASVALPAMPDMDFKIQVGSHRNSSSRDPAQVAGLSKNFNGEPIGVSQDSIFLMMNRRYNLKAQQQQLLTGK